MNHDQIADAVFNTIGGAYVQLESYNQTILSRIPEYIKEQIPGSTVTIEIPTVYHSSIYRKTGRENRHFMNICVTRQDGCVQKVQFPIMVGSDFCSSRFEPDDRDIGYISTISGSLVQLRNKEIITPYRIKNMIDRTRTPTGVEPKPTIEVSSVNSSDSNTKFKIGYSDDKGLMLTISPHQDGEIPPAPIPLPVVPLAGYLKMDLTRFPSATSNAKTVDCKLIEETVIRYRSVIGPVLTALLTEYEASMSKLVYTDLQDYGYKQINTPGQLAFRMFRSLIPAIRSAPGSAVHNIPKGYRSGSSDKTSVAHETVIKSRSHLRMTFVDATEYGGEDIRMIHPSQIGNICTAYSPETSSVGLRKELALYATVSMYRHLDWNKEIAQASDPNSNGESRALLINGKFHSMITKSNFRALERHVTRRPEYFDVVFYDERFTYGIISNGGVIGHISHRIVDGELQQFDSRSDIWKNGISSGALKFITPLVAYKESTTRTNLKGFDYCMLQPWGIYGTLALSVPFSNFNYGVRVSYNSNMATQAIDCGQLDLRTSRCKKLMNGEPPLVVNKVWRDITGSAYHSINCWVAILMQPSNNEDAIIASRNLCKTKFRYYYHTYKVIKPLRQLKSEFKGGGALDIKACGDGIAKLSVSTGLPRIGENYACGDAIYSYVITTAKGPVRKFEVASLDVNGILDKITYEYDPPQIVLSFKTPRDYGDGDKVCARYSQKAVISEVREDMGCVIEGPLYGISPDLIVSPAILPSRMTMGYIMEMKAATYLVMQEYWATGNATEDELVYMLGEDLAEETMKIPVIEGNTPSLAEIAKKRWYDASPFTSHSKIANVRIMHKYQTANGHISNVIVAPVAYMLLRHHVIDKIKKASYEAGVVHSDQLVKHRKGRLSGLKLGSQEICGFFSAGCTAFLADTANLTQSNVLIHACLSCGYINDTHLCSVCGYDTKILVVPYSVLLAHYIFITQNTCMRIYPSTDKPVTRIEPII